MVYEFYFCAHRDDDSNDQCRFSNKQVPHSTSILPWGRGYDTARCPYCSANVQVYDAPANPLSAD